MLYKNCFFWLTVSLIILFAGCTDASKYNGGRIAFTSNRDGNDEIYIMNLDGTNQINLTNHPGNDSHPVWSPDGSHIAFISDRDGATDIFTMKTDGSEQINLTNNSSYDYFPTWSPDSTQIMFISYRDNVVSNQGDPIPEIYIMDIDGSSLLRLTENHDYESHLSWAPSGDSIALAVLTESNETLASYNSVKQIYTMDLAGKNMIQLTQSIYGNEYPAWSPDGKQIAFTSYRDGNSEIYIMNVDGSYQIRLTFSDTLTAYNIQPSWSSEGDRIVFSSNRSGNYEIYIMNLDGTNQTRLTTSLSMDTYPAWSP